MIQSHTIEIRVRYCDTDAMGFLHHANHVQYFEMGRTELLRVNGGDYRQMEETGRFLVITQMNCRYFLPARYDDLLTLETTANRTTAVKIEHTYRLIRGDELLATGQTTLACVDRDGKIQRVSSLGHPFNVEIR